MMMRTSSNFGNKMLPTQILAMNGGQLMMKAYMLLTGSGPIVVLTSHASILDASLIEKLEDKGIDKFLAYEIPIGLAEQRYGGHFSLVRGDLRETDDLRVLDEDGERAFKLFRFDELGPTIIYESSKLFSG